MKRFWDFFTQEFLGFELYDMLVCFSATALYLAFIISFAVVMADLLIKGGK